MKDTVSTSIARASALSYAELINSLYDCGFEDEEVETVAENIVSAVNEALPEDLQWMPSTSEVWAWGDSVEELRSKDFGFDLDEFKELLNNEIGKAMGL